MSWLRNTWIIAKREFAAYFATPLAIVFLIIFVALTGAFAFYRRRLLRARPGRPRALLHLSPLALPAAGAGHRHAAVGGGAQDRHHRAADDAADLAVGGDPRQVPGGLGLHRPGAGPDLPDVDHRQHPGQPRQRRDPGELPRQLPDGRRVPRHRLVHLGADQEPGDRLHRRGDGLLPARHERARAGAQRVPRLGAVVPGLGDRVAELPVALRGRHQGHRSICPPSSSTCR